VAKAVAYLNHYRDMLDVDCGYTTNVANGYAWDWARARPGDLLQWFFPTTFPAIATWPAKALPLEDELNSAIGNTYYGSDFSIVTGTTWEWSPTTGWTVTKALLPEDS
jgi:hypothetical protein